MIPKMETPDNEIYHPYWENVIKSYFKQNGFVKHQIDSFNEFIDIGIQKILDEVGPIEIKTTKDSRGGEATYIIEFGKISLNKPITKEHDGFTNTLYPQEARNRNLTYHSSLYCNIKVKTIKNGEETHKVSREHLGFIPIMVKSKYCLLYNKTEKECKDLGECIYDEGGYFIVNGNEKVIVAQEKMPNNIVYCFYKKPPSKIIWQAEIRSQFEYHTKTTSTFYLRIFSRGSRNTTNNNPTFTDLDSIRGQITYIKQEIPLIFIFYALGYTSKNDIINIIINSRIPLDKSNYDDYFKNVLKFLRCSFDEAKQIIEEENTESELSKEEYQNFSLDYIGKKGSTVHGTKADRIKYAIQIINKELLPHLNLEFTDIYKQDLQITKTKAHFIGYMVNKLYISYLGIIKENDRDHLANKRLDLTGNLLSNLFKSIFKRLHKEAKVNLTKSIETNNSFDLINNIKSKVISNDIKYALSTGNWGRQTGGTPPKTGVVQQLNRLTFSSALSHLRRVNTPLNREGKQAKPRQLHSTSWSYVCPCETPEGQGCVDPDTTVLLSGLPVASALVSIKNLESVYKDTSVVTVDIGSRVPTTSEVVAFQNLKTKDFGKGVLKITTVSGRNITVTEDHSFAVPDDKFKEAGLLKKGEEVLVFPVSMIPSIYKDAKIPCVLLNRDDELIRGLDYTILRKLEEDKFIPLMSNDARLEFLVSFIVFKPSVNDDYACVNNEYVDSLRCEAQSVGIVMMSEKTETGRKIMLEKHVSELTSIIDSSIRKSDFIFNCNIRVKASFLSSVLEKNNDDIYGLTFKHELVGKLLTTFGIKSHKNKTDRANFIVSKNYNNMIKFADTIGFKWSMEKRNKMMLMAEHMRQILNNGYISWQDFVKTTRADLVTGTLYSKIVKIEPVTMEKCPVVMDMTIHDDNHTFVSNGFVTHNCGLLRNLAMTCHISIGSNTTFIVVKKFIAKYLSDKTIEVRDMTADDLYKVFIDGAWEVSVDEKKAEFIVSKLKSFRRRLMISYDTSIYMDRDSKELHIFTCYGRFCRPLLVVENLHLLNDANKDSSWNDLMLKGIIEYIDVAEEEELMIAMDMRRLRESPEKYTHMEIHPSVILGVCASIIPYPEHNQSPRNIYQSLHPDTLVSMADGTQKVIKDVKIGDTVITFDHETLSRSYSKVINQYVRPSKNDMYKITTVSGREIIATDNHSFFTDQRFKEVKYFSEKTLMGVDLGSGRSLHIDGKVKILDKEDLIMTGSENYSNTCINKYIKELNDWFGEIDINKVATLAGIIGYLLADGSLYKSKGRIIAAFCHGNEESANQLQNDLEYIGFNRNKIHKQVCTGIFGKDTDDPREVTQTAYTYQYSGSFPLLLKTLGVTIGRRTEQPSSIPEFILNGHKEVKRSFLAGIFGGDGTRIGCSKREGGKGGKYVNDTYDYNIGALSMSKVPEFADTLIDVFKDISDMLSLFGIKTGDITTYKGKFDKLEINLPPSQTTENIIKFYEEIGFKYDTYKNHSSGIVVEYLKYKDRKYNQRLNDVLTIRGKFDKGLSNREIADQHGLNIKVVNNLRVTYKKGGCIKVRHGFKDYMTFDQFKETIIEEEGTDTIFIPIEKIEKYTESNIIADITVEDQTRHDFIGNCFILRNSSMGKQATGIYTSNFNERFDTLAHVLQYPQKPLVTTAMMKYIKSEELPAGVNAIVAIGCYGGYNQEDSVIINEGALHRGLFRTTYYKTYVDQEKDIVKIGGGLMEQFEIPNKSETKGIQHGNYGKLGPDGIIEPGCRVIDGDIIIGKTTPIATNKLEISQLKKYKKRDVSTNIRQNETAVIDKVLVTTNSDGFKYTKVKVRSIRIPEIGDKLCSRHGQKGTIGMIYKHEDMPFTEDGIVPDIIINPHAIPSRMTIGHLIECLMGKLCCVSGREGDATPFNGIKVSDISSLLEQYGYSGDGTETLYNGETGEPMEAKIFMGPTYYQRLKHMVVDKEHCLTLDHEVLTLDGWKFFDQITMNDKIACLNESGDLVYDHPLELIHYGSKERYLFHIKGENIDLKVTGEHKLYVSSSNGTVDYKLVKAENTIGKELLYKNDAKINYVTRLRKTSSHYASIAPFFLCYYTGGSSLRFDNSIIMNSLLYILNVYEYGHEVNDDFVLIYNIPDYMKDKKKMCKYIAQEFNQEHSKIFIDYVTSLQSIGNFEFSDVIDDLQQIYLHAGYSSKIESGKLVVIDNEPLAYTLNAGIETCPVFCLQVPTGVFYIRRNGKACWTGNSRSTGPVTKLTRQPLEGRAKDGGLKLGEMERDVLCSHGAAFTLKDRMFYNSDAYRIHVCKLCGVICQADLDKQRFLCKCIKGGNTTEIAQVYIPYACKLFFQELMAMNILPRIKM